MNSRKAQVSLLDLIFALTLFFAIVILFAMMWNSVQNNIQNAATSESDIMAVQVTNRLLGSPGYPRDWNSTNVNLIGLSSERGVIDQAKLGNLLQLLKDNYSGAIALLGLAPYNFYINVTGIDGSPILINNQTAQGGLPPTNATEVSSVSRTAIYGEIVVHNNSITLVFDSSGSMDWYSTAINYTNSNLTQSNVWVNIYNVSFPSSPTSNFDFILEFNDTSLSGGNQVLFNVTSPSKKKYSVPSSGSSCGSGTTGCTAYAFSGAARMNFTAALWNSTGIWQVWIKKSSSVSENLMFDSIAQTPVRRIDAATNATNDLINVISNESSTKDEISFFTLANTTSCPGTCGYCANRSMVFTSGDYTPLEKAVNGTTANGATPLDQALRAAADYSNRSATRQHTMIIMLSDGSETCGGNVASAATYAAAEVGKICTVGFAQGSTGEAQMKQAATIGRCQYYAAMNATQLDIALRQIYFGNLEKQKVIINIMVWK